MTELVSKKSFKSWYRARDKKNDETEICHCIFTVIIAFMGVVTGFLSAAIVVKLPTPINEDIIGIYVLVLIAMLILTILVTQYQRNNYEYRKYLNALTVKKK